MNTSKLGETTIEDRMNEMLGGYRITQMLFVAVSFGLPDHLADVPLAIEELAQITDTHAPALSRLLRGLASVGVFHERRDGRFETSPLAETLRTDHPSQLRAFALSYGQPWWWQAFGETLYSVRTGQPGFCRAHGVGLYDYLEANPEAARLFDLQMSAMTSLEAAAIVESYSFEGQSVIVDVGGGQGVLARKVLQRWPETHSIVFDRDSLRSSGTVATSGSPTRCRFIAGDFFTDVPRGGSIYILKDILHNWNDEPARRILTVCRSAMETGTKLLVIERIITHGNSPSSAKLIDLTMLVLTGGKERMLPEYDQLLEQSGFRLVKTVELNSGGSIIEAEAM